MTRLKKTSPPTEEIISPGIYRHPIGKGFTKRNIDTREVRPGSRYKYVVGDDYPLGSLSDAIRWAKGFLKDAGLPAHKASLPFALPLTTGLSDQALPYRERQDPEWYAYEIADASSDLAKALFQENKYSALEMAYRIGNLATEAHGLGYFKKAGATGGKRKQRILPLKELIHSLRRKNRQGTAADLWAMIPTDQIDGIRIKEHKFYRNAAGRLLALGKVDGCKDWRPAGKPLKFDAFRKRVKEVRKPLAR